MSELKLKNIKQEYEGRCKIIPCRDLPKLEDNFDDLKNDIIEVFREQRIISNWTLREGALEKYDDEDLDEDERIETFWLELVCKCLNSGFLVIYEVPVPSCVRKENGKISGFSYSWGYYQTHYIHLEDISELTSVLSNLDDYIVEEVYKEEQGEKK